MTSPDPGTNVLVLAPSLSEEKTQTCLELQRGGSPAQLDVLRITYSAAPGELVEQWRDHHGELPARMGIISVGNQAGQRGGNVDLPNSVFVATANPNDITGLGMRLNNYLNDGNSDAQLVVCFDSVTEMLQFADIQPVYKFLHMFTGQVRDANGIGHFHVDPGAHDARTINRLKPLFDEAVSLST